MADEKNEENALEFHEMEIDDRILKVKSSTHFHNILFLSSFLIGNSKTFMAKSNFNTSTCNSFIVRRQGCIGTC